MFWSPYIFTLLHYETVKSLILNLNGVVFYSIILQITPSFGREWEKGLIITLSLVRFSWEF